MLRACVLDFQGQCSKYLPLIEFSYYNSYQTTIGMAPYEALYSIKCRSSVHWDEIGERKLLGSDMIREMTEVVTQIRQRMETTQSRQKSYSDQRRIVLEFSVGDRVFLKVAPMKGVMRFVELQRPYAGMHDVFHVSRLKKYQPDPEHIITRDTPPLMENLSYTERPIRIIDQQVRQLRKREIPMVKVVWQNHNRDEDATWEMEEDMRNQYPELF
ncbi:hypothetical protein DH2020_022128 [Rehmannia glutinosa]|uniref:Chromo domain-containing protein n=1 Tax=Rehmannia glutinosa TaxID=99300 RepID=A0ABR0WEN8_REHGL